MNPFSQFSNPQFERTSPAAAGNPQSDTATPGRGRPRVLNDMKRSEFCALVAGGCSVQEAARYVGCSWNTIRRELQRDPDFHEHLRRSEMYAQLSPLRAMQKAATTHWRAAAWILERAYPEHFARRTAPGLTPQQARSLLSEVLKILSSELPDPFQFERIEKRLRVTFEYAIRSAADVDRNRDDLRSMLKLSKEKDRMSDPLAAFGMSSPDLAELFRPKPPAASKPRPEPQRPAANSVPQQAPSAPINE